VILTRHNVVYHLLERGLLTVRDLLCDGVSVREQFQRNRNFRVSRPGVGGFFVKQSADLEEWGQQHSTLAREAACYELAQGNAHLERLLPAFRDFSRRSHVLVVELVEPAESMAVFHRRDGGFPPAVASTLGQQLAVCHTEFGKMLRFLDRTHPFIGEVPWTLTPERWDGHVSARQSSGQAQLLAALKSDLDLCQRLQTLAETWHVNGIIHGDMKWHNCLLDPAGGASGAAATIRIVDWELADAGHVGWDVAGILQSYLDRWIESMDFLAGETVEELVATASTSIEEMHPSVRAFWDGYIGQMDLPVPATSALRRRSVEYAAARLLQTAFEDRQDEVGLSAHTVLLLQLASNMLADPAAAAEQLFGLS
jgi:aminoglycoside phosphotransferase (APT) family kinase protein